MKKFYWIFLMIFMITGCRDHETIALFPLDHYDQTLSNWIKPSDPDYDQSLLSREIQQYHFENFYKHNFGALSPWNADYVNQILQHKAPDDLKTLEQGLFTQFSNQSKPEEQIGYGENFRPHSQNWIDTIANNINVSELDHLNYQASHRAIAVENLPARVLPTDDPYYFSYKIAGEGYPFDNLQMSSVWVGTPLYILSETKDHAWSLVITPDFIAWVKTSGIARANEKFISTWETAAKKQLAGITRTTTSMVDTKGVFRFSAYIGSFFPAEKNSEKLKLMIPIADENKQAVIHYALLSENDAAMMPWSVTPHHISYLMSSLLGRPYGWGNLYFYNDCSSELKNLFAVFGIWLPRHSSDQVYVGKQVDLSAEPAADRLSYLMANGHKLMTIVYIDGHILLYIGNYQNPHSKNHEAMAMTYQTMWGLRPNPSTSRQVVGETVLFPMLEQYPEDPKLMSQADKKHFQVSLLDDTPANHDLLHLEILDLRELMYP